MRTIVNEGADATRAAARSNGSRPVSTCRSSRPVSTCSRARRRNGPVVSRPAGRLAPWPSRRSSASRPSIGVTLRGAPDPNPVRRVEPAHQRLRRAAPGRLGLRGRVARAATRAGSRATARNRPRSRPTSSTRCSRTAPATTSTTRTPSTRRPSAATRCRPCCSTRRGSASSPGRWTRPGACCRPGQEIVVYKNNSDGKGNSYGCHENYLVDRNVPFAHARPQPHPVVRDPPGVHRRGQGRRRERRRRGRLPDQPARRLLRGGGRARDDVEASDREHARRAARRSAEVPPAARDRRRREPVRDRDVPQGAARPRSCSR